MEPSQLLHELNRFLLRNDDASVPQFEESFGSIIDVRCSFNRVC